LFFELDITKTNTKYTKTIIGHWAKKVIYETLTSFIKLLKLASQHHNYTAPEKRNYGHTPTKNGLCLTTQTIHIWYKNEIIFN